MVALILCAVLFMCGLLNSYFFSPSKLMAWLSSMLPIAFLFPKTTNVEVRANKEKASVVDKAELETAFATFDRNGDGFITAKELEESLAKLGLFSSNKEVTGMMEKLDSNGDGQIDLEEFRELYESIGRGEELVGGAGEDEEGILDKGLKEDEEEGDLKEAFDVFDGNGDGLITVEELSMVLTSLGLKQGSTKANCRDMIKKVDLDGDGMVSFEEFKQMMRAKGGMKLF